MPVLGFFPILQKIKIWWQKYEVMGIQLSDWVENIVGKGEIARYEQLLPYPQCFQNVVNTSKSVSMEWRVKQLESICTTVNRIRVNLGLYQTTKF